jgi:hypothetical protein
MGVIVRRSGCQGHLSERVVVSRTNGVTIPLIDPPVVQVLLQRAHTRMRDVVDACRTGIAAAWEEHKGLRYGKSMHTHGTWE